MRRLAIFTAALVLVFTAGPAGAAKPGESDSKEIGQYVDLQPVGLPIVNDTRQVVNYVFVYVRINLTSRADTSKLREKEPYFRDALVRSAHRAPYSVPNDYNVIDLTRLCATMKREAEGITGPGMVKSVTVTSWSARWKVASPRRGA